MSANNKRLANKWSKTGCIGTAFLWVLIQKSLLPPQHTFEQLPAHETFTGAKDFREGTQPFGWRTEILKKLERKGHSPSPLRVALAPPARDEGEVGTLSLWTLTKANVCGPAGTQAQCTIPVPPVAPEASSFPCSRLPQHLSGSRPQVASLTPGSGSSFPRTWALRAHGCLPTPEAPDHSLEPPATSSTQALANCCHTRLSPCLKATRPQDSVPDTGPWWASTNPGQLTSVSTGSSGPRKVPRPRAAPKSPSSVAAANRGLQLRTPAASDGFPSTRFSRGGSPRTEAQLTWASASSRGPRWVSGHQLASFCSGSQRASERRPAGSRSGGYSCGRTQVASQLSPTRLLSVRLSQPAEAWSHYRTSGFLRLLCGTVDSEARHKPLFPGAWLTPLDPESRAQTHQKRL